MGGQCVLPLKKEETMIIRGTVLETEYHENTETLRIRVDDDKTICEFKTLAARDVFSPGMSVLMNFEQKKLIAVMPEIWHWSR